MDIFTVITIFFVVVTTMFGVVIGSFLNVVIYRIPEGRTIVKGHSMCMSCGHNLGALDLVPIFSWLFLGGKCRYCKAPVASRYIKIESFTGLVFLLYALTHTHYQINILDPYNFPRLVFFISYCIVLLMYAALVSSMMIYYDKQKAYYGFTVFSASCAVVLTILTSFVADYPSAILYLLVSCSVALIIVGVLALFCKICRKKYTSTDFWLDLPYAIFYAYFGALLIQYDYSVIAAVVFLILPRLFLKGTKLEKYSAIVSTCGLVLANVVGFVINLLTDNLFCNILSF